jgi:hypothetical protein
MLTTGPAGVGVSVIGGDAGVSFNLGMQAASSPEEPTTTVFKKSRLEIPLCRRGNFDDIDFSFLEAFPDCLIIALIHK